MSEITVCKERKINNPNTTTYDERQQELVTQTKKEKEAYERAKKSPYERFFQMNKDYYKAEDWLMSKSPIAYRIFKFLINGMDDYNAVVCSYKVLEENFNISKATVTRSIKLLKEKKYIDVYKSGTSNVYAVNKNIVWNSWGTNFQYAKFGANIILSESEQEECVKNNIKPTKHKELALEA